MEGDENRLKQILLNLISNAFKFTKSGGYVRIEVESLVEELNNPILSEHRSERSMAMSNNIEQDSSPRIQFSVIDNGIGIKPENTPKLFTAFGMLQESAVLNPTGIFSRYICIII